MFFTTAGKPAYIWGKERAMYSFTKIAVMMGLAIFLGLFLGAVTECALRGKFVNTYDDGDVVAVEGYGVINRVWFATGVVNRAGNCDLAQEGYGIFKTIFITTDATIVCRGANGPVGHIMDDVVAAPKIITYSLSSGECFTTPNGITRCVSVGHNTHDAVSQ